MGHVKTCGFIAFAMNSEIQVLATILGPVWPTLGVVWARFPRNLRQGRPQDAYMTMEAALGDSWEAFGLPFGKLFGIRHRFFERDTNLPFVF